MVPKTQNLSNQFNHALYDLIGVGIGPFNLSLSALAHPSPLKGLFLDKKKEFSWYQRFPDTSSDLQVSYLKDLVVPVDPTNKFSFLNYLVSENRIYEFLNRRISAVSRSEFNLYYKWAAEQIPSLRFTQEVIGLDYTNEHFKVFTPREEYRCKNLSIATGRVNVAAIDTDPEIRHNIHLCSNYKAINFSLDESVLVVGGGQSGAEVVYDLLIRKKVARIIWVSSRNNLLPLDDSSFINEFYGPAYRNHFMQFEESVKRVELEGQRMTSDGISTNLLNNLYNQLYENKYLNEQKVKIEMLFNTRVECINSGINALEATIINTHTKKAELLGNFDKVILATGFKPVIPSFMLDFMESICVDSLNPEINRDMSIRCQVKLPGKIFLQNRSREQHGLQDSNLALVSYRNALIINSILKNPFYKNLSEDSTLISSFSEDTRMNDQLIK